MKGLLVVALLALSGCVTSKQVMLPNGAKGYSMDCSGIQHDAADCMNRAATLCGGAYTILSQTSESLAFNPNSRTMIVACAAP